MSFAFKTTPFAHQLRIWDDTRDKTAWGLFMGTGTGKTFVALNTCAQKYLNGFADGLLVVAPSGVHQNWVYEEIPTHLPENVPYDCLAYYTPKAKTKWQQEAVAKVIASPGLAILTMSYDAIKTPAGRAVAEEFLTKRKAMMVLDESHRIKTPSSQQTQACVAIKGNSGLGCMAKYRWILTGTPVTNSPLDVYSQVRFLDPDFWVRHKLSPFTVFKRTFCVQILRSIPGRRPFYDIVGYQNLDYLHELLSTISTRITKEECLDLPPKLYQKRYFELPPATQRLYKDLRDNFMVELEGGAEITAPLAIVRLTRLQQITCGFVTVDGERQVTPLEKNPRIDALMEVLSDSNIDSAIIWAHFTRDIDNIVAALGGDKCAVIDGRVPDSERKDLVKKFQSGEVPFFVGNPAAISEGITLHRTATVIYYSNGYKLSERLQSEDRAHRIGQKRNVTIIDLVAEGTVDTRIVKALREKQNIASQVTGDNLREWI